MTKFKVVITDYEYKSLAEEQAVFEKAGIELVPAQCRTEEEVIEATKVKAIVQLNEKMKQ